MSGAEAIAILGLISSIITIIETSKSLYDAASDVKGLHEAYRAVSVNIPIILETLRDCKRIQQRADDIHRTSTDATVRRDLEESAKAVKPILVACESNAKRLKTIFEEIIPSKHASRFDRYRKAAKAVSPERRRKVEELMKDLLEKLQLLLTNHYFKTHAATENQASNITAAIKQLSILPGEYHS